MPLAEYRKKRALTKTPEPAGGTPATQKLQFVVQKHHASHLHYDFRLEVKGVLKSWAVPKGPSVNPADHRLAMLVEDHPYDYKNFEGIIPKGNYGAGTVIVWDTGTYEPAATAKTKAEQENVMLKEFYAGAINIILYGKKLKGAFTLVKTASRGETAWLLTKKKDSHAVKADIGLKDASVLSGKTLEEMARDSNAKQWKSNRSKGKTPAPIPDIDSIIKQGIKAPMPASIDPMLCTLTKEVLNDSDYLYEVKWDGYRIISYCSKGKARLDSRSALDYTAKYPPVVKAIQSLGHDIVLDGEVTVFNQEGQPDFDALQKYNGHNTPIFYCVFDILWIDGYSLIDLPLESRKELLQVLISDKPGFKFSDSFDNGPALYGQALKMNLEGIVAKKRDSAYHPGQRANDWLKTPTRKRQEFVIGGYAESDKNRSFRSLLFGAYNNGKLEWIGRSGGGYKEKEMPGILKQLQALEIPESPFANKVLDTKGAVMHWVKPQLVANFEFATWTKSGRIRKPATFLGFRKDKKARDVVREVPKEVDVIEEQVHEEDAPVSKPAQKTNARQKPLAAMPSSNWPKLENIPVERRETFEFGDCSIELSDVERDIWKGIPKAKLIEYYHSVAKYMLPFLKDRAQSLHVKPVNAGAPGFYIKDMEGRQPDCAQIYTDTRRHKTKGKHSTIDYLVCNNESTLLWMVNLGCIDINPWSSRVATPESPDFILVDLDPTVKGEQERFLDKLIDTAMATKEFCDKYKLKAFAKTSGKTGIHFYIPCSGIIFTQARRIAEHICGEVHSLVPNASTCANSINSRGDKVYVDPSQNDYADTLAAPYSVRPYHIPTVSTPLEWKEINKKLQPSDFTMDAIADRLKRKGDLFKDILSKKIAAVNTKILQQFL